MMKRATINPAFEGEAPSQSEIASLALKFYQDSRGELRQFRENWLCAEYMLMQKRLIECQISGFHDRVQFPVN